MTSDAILNNKRRLERHTRRDGQLQSRARPASLEERSDDINAGSAAYIRNYVEKADLDRRFNIFSFDSPSTASDAASDDSATSAAADASGAQTTARNGNNGNGNGNNNNGNGDNTTSAAARTTSRAATTTQAQRATSTIANNPVVENTLSSASVATRRTTHSTAVAASTKAPVLTTTAAAAQATTAASSASSSSLNLSTAVAFVTASSPSQSADIAASSSTTTAKSNSSGVGVGPIIGIVAGCLAGVAVLAVIAGYLFKKFGRKEDPYETDPFSSDDFRRNSAMLPETFESEDGLGEMAEYQHNNMSPFGYDNGGGYGGAAVAGGVGAMAGGMAAASAYNSRSNDNGGRPRPPSMFEKHINGQAAYNNSEHLPQVGNVYNPNDPSPQLPAMAYGGSDPYSIAGVGRNHQMDNNTSNPYAHLDRSPSAMRNVSQGGQIDRGNGSNGSSYQQYPEQYQTPMNEYDYDTAGRPGTAEGRSGTPDLPNVQQTYAGTSTDGRQDMDRVASPRNMMSSPELPHEYYSQAGYETNNVAPQQQSLQVRNLLPNPSQMHHQPPRMSAVSEQAGEDDAYGGVW